MRYNTFSLSNGLRVIHLPSPSPVVYCGYEINAGSRDERPGEEGLAHFCEHITFKGTRHRRAWNILNCLESVGGDLNAFTNKEDTVYYAAILKDHTGRAINLLTDIVFHSTYPQKEIDKEVEVICNEIESYNDTPSDLIYDEFENLVFKGLPLGHNILGSSENVRTFHTEDALRFTRKFYRPDNAVFFIYGDVDFKKVIKAIAKAFEQEPLDILPGERRQNATPLYHPRNLTMNKGTHQAHVMIGCQAYDINHPLRIPLFLLNNILGGPGMNARLNLALREHHGLVYTVESSMVSYGDAGLWCVYFGCDPEDIDRCLRLVRRQLDKFIGQKLTDRQLSAAKKQLKGQIGVACDNRENFALDFGKSFLHYGRERDPKVLYEEIEAVTAAQIQQVAAELFPEDNLSVLIYK